MRSLTFSSHSDVVMWKWNKCVCSVYDTPVVSPSLFVFDLGDVSFFLVQFSSNTVRKSINVYTEKISVGEEGRIQKRTRHRTWDASRKLQYNMEILVIVSNWIYMIWCVLIATVRLLPIICQFLSFLYSDFRLTQRRLRMNKNKQKKTITTITHEQKELNNTNKKKR